MKNKVVKILATLGLIVAIALILIGVFDVGKIGFKNLFSKRSSLPTLKCTFDDSNDTQSVQIYNLSNIKRNDPIRNSKSYEEKKKLAHGDGKFLTLLSEEDNNYSILAYNNENGISKGYTVTINRTTGEAEFILPLHHKVDASVEEVAYAIIGGQRFKGMCIKLEDKNL